MFKILKKGHLKFIDHNKRNGKNKRIKTKNKILIDFFDDYPVIFTLSLMKKYLQKKYNSNFEYFTFNKWQNVQISPNKSFIDNIKSLIRRFSSQKVLSKIFDSFGVSQGVILNYNNFYFYKIAEKESKKIFQNLKKIDDVYLIKYKNFNLGRYIYQSYLRDYNEPTINLSDKRLYKVIKKSLLIYLNIEQYFKDNNVKILIPSHTVYLYYGIITAYAYKKKCKVFRVKSTGFRDNQSAFLSKVDKRISEAPPTHNYKKIFKNFDHKQKIIYWNLGKKNLLNRYKGKIEPHLAGNKVIYHKKKSNLKFNKKKEKILLFLPCFFDGPGRHKNLLFPDFFQWTVFMLKKASKTKFDWYIKPHPMGLPGNDQIIKNLKEKYSDYKNIIFLDKNISNKYLTNLNFKSLFCHHGNCVPEFAYKNIPVVIACSDYSSSFDIAIRAKSKKNLNDLINKANKIKFKPNIKHIYEYIYMHFIYSMGYVKENRIFNRNLEKEINKFHDTHYVNITSHKFLKLFNDQDYKFSEKKIKFLLNKIKI